MASLQKFAKCRCGYCHIADVESHEQDDHMESFFLSETVGGSILALDFEMCPRCLSVFQTHCGTFN